MKMNNVTKAIVESERKKGSDQREAGSKRIGFAGACEDRANAISKLTFHTDHSGGAGHFLCVPKTHPAIISILG